MASQIKQTTPEKQALADLAVKIPPLAVAQTTIVDRLVETVSRFSTLKLAEKSDQLAFKDGQVVSLSKREREEYSRALKERAEQATQVLENLDIIDGVTNALRFYAVSAATMCAVFGVIGFAPAGIVSVGAAFTLGTLAGTSAGLGMNFMEFVASWLRGKSSSTQSTLNVAEKSAFDLQTSATTALSALAGIGAVAHIFRNSRLALPLLRGATHSAVQGVSKGMLDSGINLGLGRAVSLKQTAHDAIESMLVGGLTGGFGAKLSFTTRNSLAVTKSLAKFGEWVADLSLSLAGAKGKAWWQDKELSRVELSTIAANSLVGSLGGSLTEASRARREGDVSRQQNLELSHACLHDSALLKKTRRPIFNSKQETAIANVVSALCDAVDGNTSPPRFCRSIKEKCDDNRLTSAVLKSEVVYRILKLGLETQNVALSRLVSEWTTDYLDCMLDLGTCVKNCGKKDPLSKEIPDRIAAWLPYKENALRKLSTLLPFDLLSQADCRSRLTFAHSLFSSEGLSPFARLRAELAQEIAGQLRVGAPKPKMCASDINAAVALLAHGMQALRLDQLSLGRGFSHSIGLLGDNASQIAASRLLRRNVLVHSALNELFTEIGVYAKGRIDEPILTPLARSQPHSPSLVSHLKRKLLLIALSSRSRYLHGVLGKPIEREVNGILANQLLSLLTLDNAVKLPSRVQLDLFGDANEHFACTSGGSSGLPSREDRLTWGVKVGMESIRLRTRTGLHNLHFLPLIYDSAIKVLGVKVPGVSFVLREWGKLVSRVGVRDYNRILSSGTASAHSPSIMEQHLRDFGVYMHELDRAAEKRFAGVIGAVVEDRLTPKAGLERVLDAISSDQESFTQRCIFRYPGRAKIGRNDIEPVMGYYIDFRAVHAPLLTGFVFRGLAAEAARTVDVIQADIKAAPNSIDAHFRRFIDACQSTLPENSLSEITQSDAKSLLGLIMLRRSGPEQSDLIPIASQRVHKLVAIIELVELTKKFTFYDRSILNNAIRQLRDIGHAYLLELTNAGAPSDQIAPLYVMLYPRND